MNKVIEVDFLPREFQSEAFVAHSTSNDFGARKESRILIVDNDHNTTHLVKILLKKRVAMWCSKRTTPAGLIRAPGVSGRT